MAMVNYRPARAAEIHATIDLFMTALADVYARHGIMTPLPERKTVELLYGYILRTGIFHVAEIEGRLAAICHAVVRDQLWFLSGFWALPELRGKRIGGQLLRQVRAEGEALGARKFFTWSSIDLTAMACYLRAGLLPGYQLLTFIGPTDGLPPGPDAYEIQALALSTAVRLDKHVRETGREIDHRFWLEECGHEARQVMRDGKIVGYYYYNRGLIGPLVWMNERDAEPMLALACLEASTQEGVEQLRLMIPGINHTALRFALQAGLRLTGYSHLLTTAPIGQMEQYLPSGPSLF